MYALVRLTSNDQKIVDGTLDKIQHGMLEFNREGKLTKPKRNYNRRKDKMATSTVTPIKTEREVPEMVETPYGFKLKGNGKHFAQKRVFNLDTLERETKEREYDVLNLTDLNEAMKSIEDQRLLALINLGLQKEALMNAKKAIGGSNAKTVLNFINNFRNLPQFAKIEERKKQTEEVMNFIKSVTPMYDQLKQLAAESKDEDGQDDDDND